MPLFIECWTIQIHSVNIYMYREFEVIKKVLIENKVLGLTHKNMFELSWVLTKNISLSIGIIIYWSYMEEAYMSSSIWRFKDSSKEQRCAQSFYFLFRYIPLSFLGIGGLGFLNNVAWGRELHNISKLYLYLHVVWQIC